MRSWPLLLLAACAGAPVPDGPDRHPADLLPPGPGSPSAPVIELRPLAPHAWNTLHVRFVQPSVDPDGDPVGYSVRWRVNNVLVASSDRTWLPRTYIRRGDSVTASVEANDGFTSSPWATAGPVVIQNTPPRLVSGRLRRALPAGGRVAARVTCSDYDGDATVAVYTWFVNGVPVPSVQSAPLPAGITVAGDRVEVEVYCDDFTDVGQARRMGPVIVQP